MGYQQACLPQAGDKHSLEIFDIIANLMHVPEGPIELDWARVYLTYMSESREVEIDHTTAPMMPYAISCYEDLREILDSRRVR